MRCKSENNEIIYFEDKGDFKDKILLTSTLNDILNKGRAPILKVTETALVALLREFPQTTAFLLLPNNMDDYYNRVISKRKTDLESIESFMNKQKSIIENERISALSKSVLSCPNMEENMEKLLKELSSLNPKFKFS